MFCHICHIILLIYATKSIIAVFLCGGNLVLLVVWHAERHLSFAVGFRCYGVAVCNGAGHCHASERTYTSVLSLVYRYYHRGLLVAYRLILHVYVAYSQCGGIGKRGKWVAAFQLLESYSVHSSSRNCERHLAVGIRGVFREHRSVVKEDVYRHAFHAYSSNRCRNGDIHPFLQVPLLEVKSADIAISIGHYEHVAP